MWRKLLLISGLVLVAGLLAAEFTLPRPGVWDGHPEVTISIDTSSTPPSAVGCCVVLGGREMAGGMADDYRNLPRTTRIADLLFDRSPGLFAEPFVGAPLRPRVWVSGRLSLFGREIRRSQQQFVLVGAEWPDARRVWKVVEIPDGRVSKVVRVALP